MSWNNISITDYKKIAEADKVEPVKKVNKTVSFSNYLQSGDPLDVAKRMTASYSRDSFEKEEQQKIGGIDFDQFLFTYDKTIGDQNQPERVGDKVDKQIEEQWKNHKSDYAYLADENGAIEYNGTVFSYNSTEDVITLGDMTREEDVLNINLSGGTVLRVNRNSIDGLVKAIGMFKPEDVRRIMDAIAIDAKAKSKTIEIEKQIIDVYDNMMEKKSGIDKKEEEK